MIDLKAKLAEWYAKHFISWAEAKSKLSIKWNLLLIGAGSVWAFLPPDVQTSIVTAVLDTLKLPTSWAVVIIGVVGAFLRLKKQEPKE